MKRLLALFALGFAVALQAAPPSGSIEDFVATEMPASGAPGLAWAVIENGEIRAEARGETRAGSGDKVTADTPFLLGSISKSFTAMAVMQLAEAGKLDIDAPIGGTLEAFADGPGKAITPRQLMSHTSGYSTLQGNQGHVDRTGNDDELAQQVAAIARWTPAAAPGSSWAYSNANYQILGALIETVSGEDYAGYIRAHILTPIGMTHSFVSDGKPHPGMAIGHRPWFGGKQVFDGIPQRGIAPAGGVIASAGDLARYLAVMMNGETDVLSAEGKAMMMRPAGPASPHYGLGWEVQPERGVVFHTGTSPGVETLAGMVPATKKGVVVLVNAGSGFGFGETADLRHGIAARALGIDYAGQSGAWSRQALFLSFAIAPAVFVLCIAWAWFRRDALRAKRRHAFGLFSLWFPLLMMLGVTAMLLLLIPLMFGASLGTIQRFAPDLALAMFASVSTGLAWAMVRLGLAYGGRRSAGA